MTTLSPANLTAVSDQLKVNVQYRSPTCQEIILALTKTGMVLTEGILLSAVGVVILFKTIQAGDTFIKGGCISDPFVKESWWKIWSDEWAPAAVNCSGASKGKLWVRAKEYARQHPKSMNADVVYNLGVATLGVAGAIGIITGLTCLASGINLIHHSFTYLIHLPHTLWES